MRTTTAAQAEALKSLDRSTYVRVWSADSGGTLQNTCALHGEDFFERAVIEADVDNPISAATFTFARKMGALSLVPLDETSPINQTSGSYAPFLHPYRNMRVDVCTLTAGSRPAESDWIVLWEGMIDSVDWGGNEGITVRARDPMARLNDTFIETVATYGNNSGTKSLETTIQEILTANISSPSMTLTYTATSFAVREYELANVTVLEALKELVDFIGWNLSWRWDASAGAMRLTLWQPARTSTSALYEFTPDDYYMIPGTSLALEGIRNAVEVVYTDTAGAEQSVTSTGSASIALYGRRFMRIDARGTSVVTSGQATTLADNVVDDLEESNVQQDIECAFFWPAELGDLYSFAPNDHYTSAQQWATTGYTHVLSSSEVRTRLRVTGKPSGGYERWHNKEVESLDNAPGVSAADVAITAHTGTISETTKWTRVIPANRLGLKGGVRLTLRAATVGTAGDKTVRFKLNGTAWIAHTVAAAIADDFEYTVILFNNNATNDQRIFTRIDRDGGTATPVLSSATDAEDSTADMTITVTVELANAGDSVTIGLALHEYVGVAGGVEAAA